jgi:hypothetical protein
MPTVLTDGLTMVKGMMPGLIGTNKRWTDELVQTLLVAADRQTRERLGMHVHEQIIALADNDASYDLDPEFVGISLVEFALDGTNYDWKVVAASYDEFDAAHPKWRTVRNSRPEGYYLASAPGVQAGTTNYSQIVIYPCPSTAGSGSIRVSGFGVVPVANQATATAPLDVLKKCHVPFVQAILYHKEQPQLSMGYLQDFDSGCAILRDRYFKNQMLDRPSRGTM